MKYQAPSIQHRIFSCIAIIVIPLLGCVNCSSSPAPTLPPRLPNAEELLKTRSANTLGPGDVIEVRVYREPDLSGLYHVSPAGTFNFPLIGEVKANKGGIYELTSEITQRLKQEYLRDPQVTVLIKETRSKKVFVLGMVKKPGSFVFDSQMTVVQAIALAGGLQALASRSIVLIRENDDGTDQKFRIPFKEISQGKAPNSPLEPGDILFVPESWY
jgi:protein involved in polysaccharide export with SLBB domain